MIAELNPSKSSLKTGAIVGIVLGAVAFAATLSAIVTIIIIRRHSRYQAVSKKRSCKSSRLIESVNESYRYNGLTDSVKG